MKRFSIFPLFILLFWVTGFIIYVKNSYSYKFNSSPSNVIVVFNGEKQWIDTAVSFLKAGYAPLLFIAGIESPAQLKKFLAEYHIVPDKVIYSLRNEVLKSTKVAEATNFILSRNISSIRLIIPNYDMILVLDELRSLLPPGYGVTIIPTPVVSEKREVKMFLKSYNQYLKLKIYEFFNKLLI